MKAGSTVVVRIVSMRKWQGHSSWLLRGFRPVAYECVVNWATATKTRHSMPSTDSPTGLFLNLSMLCWRVTVWKLFNLNQVSFALATTLYFSLDFISRMGREMISAVNI